GSIEGSTSTVSWLTSFVVFRGFNAAAPLKYRSWHRWTIRRRCFPRHLRRGSIEGRTLPARRQDPFAFSAASPPRLHFPRHRRRDSVKGRQGRLKLGHFQTRGVFTDEVITREDP